MSVVLPAFNAERTIEAALESVVAQSFDDWELILCDDASTDSTRAVAVACLQRHDVRRWRVLELEHCGPSEARNRGIDAARATWIAFLDDDDIWEPGKLEACVRTVEDDQLDLVCHDEVWENDEGDRQLHRYSALFDRRLPPLVSVMRNNPFSTSAVLVNRARLIEAGGFDPTLPSAEDYDLWLRLAMLPGMRFGFVEQALGRYRVRAGSESSATDRRLQALLMIGERYADPVARASPLGGLEPWIFRAKTYMTTGIRLLRQRRIVRGLRLLLLGVAMWPFRLDLIRIAIAQRTARRTARRTAHGTA